MNLLTKQKGPHGLGNELRLAGGRDRQGVGEVMCTLQYLKWIATKDLPCSTGDAAQCHVAPGWEGSLGENGDMDMHGWIALLCIRNCHSIVNRLYANTK